MKVKFIPKAIIKKNTYKLYPNTKENFIKLLNKSGMIGTNTTFDELDAFLLKQGKNITK